MIYKNYITKASYNPENNSYQLPSVILHLWWAWSINISGSYQALWNIFEIVALSEKLTIFGLSKF
jgi:hypothetical protein